jgi:hypothetical protein
MSSVSHKVMAMRIKSALRWRARWLFLVCAAGLAGCGSLLPAAPPNAETQVAQAVSLTLTAIGPAPSATASLTLEQSPTATATPLPAPTSTRTPLPPPTAVRPTSELFPNADYVLDEEWLIGEFALRVWRNQASDGFGFDRIATLAQAETTPIQIEFFQAINPLTGADINGDGIPDAVIETFTGGAHCCLSTLVFSLGAQAEKIMETRPSNCGGQFADLDGDGALEYVTCDDIFAYTYCPYAASPLATVVLAYRAGRGYVPVSPEFPAVYASDLDRLRPQAENGQPGELGEWDGTSKCSVLPYVLALLYSGQGDVAWGELARVYPGSDRDAFRAEIEATVAQSEFYAPG